MTMQTISAALRRVESILHRRPEVGLHDDAPATARWEGGMRVVSSHANGTRLATDMPSELGGSGDQVTAGWMFRAALASCAATRIAMGAATAGIELTNLEVLASSRSDVRGILGMADSAGVPVQAGPCDLRLLVRISSRGISAERLRTLVEESYRCSPVPSSVVNAVPVDLRIDIGTD